MRGPVTTAGAVLVLALLLVVLLALYDGAVVRGADDLRAVTFGRPFPWLVQDQPLDPPLPWTASPMSPQQAITGVRALPLLASWGVLAAVLAPVAVVLVRLRRRRRA